MHNNCGRCVTPPIRESLVTHESSSPTTPPLFLTHTHTLQNIAYSTHPLSTLSPARTTMKWCFCEHTATEIFLFLHPHHTVLSLSLSFCIKSQAPSLLCESLCHDSHCREQARVGIHTYTYTHTGSTHFYYYCCHCCSWSAVSSCINDHFVNRSLFTAVWER